MFRPLAPEEGQLPGNTGYETSFPVSHYRGQSFIEKHLATIQRVISGNHPASIGSTAVPQDLADAFGRLIAWGYGMDKPFIQIAGVIE